MVEAVEPLAREWDELADSAGADPFVRPGWMDAWYGAFGSGDPLVLTLRRGGRLAGVLPLVRKKSALGSASNWHTPEFAPLGEDRDAVLEITEALFARSPAHVSFYFVDTGSPGLEAFRSAASRARYVRHERMLERSPYVDITGDWQSYEAGLSRKFLRDADRRWRKLEQEGEVAVEVADGSSRLDELLHDGFRIEPSGWKGSRGTAILADAPAYRFYTQMAEWAASRGWLRLAFLRVDGCAVAFQLGVEEGGVYYFIKGGYDPAFSRYAPARLLVRAMLERAFARSLRSFEFLGSDEPWKLEWTQSTRERRELRAFRRTPAGLGRWAAFEYVRPAAKRMRAVDQLVLRLRR